MNIVTLSDQQNDLLIEIMRARLTHRFVTDELQLKAIYEKLTGMPFIMAVKISKEPIAISEKIYEKYNTADQSSD